MAAWMESSVMISSTRRRFVLLALSPACSNFLKSSSTVLWSFFNSVIRSIPFPFSGRLDEATPWQFHLRRALKQNGPTGFSGFREVQTRRWAGGLRTKDTVRSACFPAVFLSSLGSAYEEGGWRCQKNALAGAGC